MIRSLLCRRGYEEEGSCQRNIEDKEAKGMSELSHHMKVINSLAYFVLHIS
jgi:hypothetical protein